MAHGLIVLFPAALLSFVIQSLLFFFPSRGNDKCRGRSSPVSRGGQRFRCKNVKMDKAEMSAVPVTAGDANQAKQNAKARRIFTTHGRGGAGPRIKQLCRRCARPNGRRNCRAPPSTPRECLDIPPTSDVAGGRRPATRSRACASAKNVRASENVPSRQNGLLEIPRDGLPRHLLLPLSRGELGVTTETRRY